MNRILLVFAGISLFGQTMFAQEFTRIEDEAGIDVRHIDEYIMGGGAAFFDSNNDGYIDIYVTGGELPDKLYINNQDGTYTESASDAGFSITSFYQTNGVCTGDIDNDGDRDVFITTASSYPNLLFENQGDGTYIDISTAAGVDELVWSTSVSMGDYNLDGYLDIYVGNYVTIEGLPNIPFYEQLNQPIPNYFYINNGDNTFTESADDLNIDISGGTLAVTFTDYDKDHDVDIYVANDFGGLFGANSLFRNNYPSESFSNLSSTSGLNAAINAMGIAIGDYDEDLKYDYYVSNMTNNLFYENDGDNTFTNVANLTNTECVNGVSWGTFFFDYNNDTYLDLYVANGGVLMQNIDRRQRNSLYTLDQGFEFTESNDFTLLEDSAISRGAIYGDIDNDGDLDIFVVNISDTLSTFNAHLLRNDLDNGMAWLKIKLQGVSNNYDAFGSYITVYVNDHAYVREIDGGSTYQSQNSSIAHFGLGTNQVIDSVVVSWLGGETQVLYDVATKQSLHIIEGIDYNFSSTMLCSGDSVFHNDNWLSQGGTYYDTTYVNDEIGSIQAFSIISINEIFTNTEMVINDGDSVLLGGAYQSAEGFYIDTLINEQGCDTILTTHLIIQAANAINEIANSDWNLYPNPSSGLFTLELHDQVFIQEVSVYSIIGNLVNNQVLNEKRDRIEFNLLDQSEGIYFINVSTPDRNFTKKIILNK